MNPNRGWPFLKRQFDKLAAGRRIGADPLPLAPGWFASRRSSFFELPSGLPY
jgi:hypothetical protein